MRDGLIKESTGGAWFLQFGPMHIHCDMLSTLLRILFHEAPITLRLTVISSETLGPRRWLLSSSHFLRSS